LGNYPKGAEPLVETELESSLGGSITATASPAAWTKLVTHLNKWFHKPDLEALEIVLSAMAAHNATEADPVWLFVQGPSGSGKGEIIVNATRNHPHVQILGTLNQNTFISFYRGETGGILPKLAATNNSGIFVFKDFTTLLSLRQDERTTIISQLREIYDGSWTRDSGAGNYVWTGRVTCIAACTPALEDHWAVTQAFGERFLTVRWPRRGEKELARKAGRQRGHEKVIRMETAVLAKAFLDTAKFKSLPEIPDVLCDRLSSLSEIVAVLRTHVNRNTYGGREIAGSGTPEEPGRIYKSLSAIVAAHAALWKREPNEDDYRLAVRVGLDSIPSRRLRVFRHFKGSDALAPGVVAKAARVPTSTVIWNAEEMVVIGALDTAQETPDILGNAPGTDPRLFLISPKFTRLIAEANLPLPLPFDM
jgi:hypothetical protein